MDPEESKKRRTQQECEFMCVPMSMWKSMVSRGLPQSSGSSDTMHMQGSGYSDNLDSRCAWVTHTRDKQSSGSSDTMEMETMSNLSRSWIAVNKNDVGEVIPDNDEDFNTWWNGFSSIDKGSEELATHGMDMDDTQDSRGGSQDEGIVSP